MGWVSVTDAGVRFLLMASAVRRVLGDLLLVTKMFISMLDNNVQQHIH